MATTKVITGEVRFSYVTVFTPSAMNEGEEPKYSVSIIIPKSDKDTLDKINKAIEAAKEVDKAKLADKSGKVPANLRTPLRDGDLDRPDSPEYAGCYFINANSSRKPGIVDANLEPIMSQDEFYSGCYGRASINFYGYNFNGVSKGIGCGLNNLQKLRDGERFGGGSSAADDFADDLA